MRGCAGCEAQRREQERRGDERRRLRRRAAIGKDQPSSAALDAALPFDFESAAPESLS